MAKVLTVPAVIIDSQEATIYFAIHFPKDFFFQEIVKVFLPPVMTKGSGSVNTVHN